MPMPWCHILRARLRQQYEGDKSTLPVRDNYSACGLTPKRKSLFFFYSSLFLRAIRLLSKTSAGVR